MKILLLGKNGQVGWELQRALASLGRLIAFDRDEADLSRPDTLPALVARVSPDVIVNAAAYTAVDRAESDEAQARCINATAVGELARAAAATGAWLVHFSTDYVFSGAGTQPWVESDAVGPLSAYGRTKLAGEEAIRASGCRHLILRTSWVYADRGGNFVRTMLRLAADRDALNVVADQFGAPTAAELIADTTALMLYRLAADAAFAERASGTYHLVAAGETSWHGFASHVIETARRLGAPVRVPADAIRPIPTAGYPTPAARPANSRLSIEKLAATFTLTMPDWRVHADRIVAALVLGANR